MNIEHNIKILETNSTVQKHKLEEIEDMGGKCPKK